MDRNLVLLERSVRAVFGLGLLSLVFIGPQTYWGLLGLLPLASAAMGRCPPLALIGIKSCPAKAPASGRRS